MACLLNYIPQHLHANDRPNIAEFNIGEFLYRRCKIEEIDNPFDSLSLVDISVNRQGFGENILSTPEDVLYNTSQEKYPALQRFDMHVSYLEIEELNDQLAYEKSNAIEHNECTILLRHKKEECMYCHCAFEIYYNGTEMTWENYKDSLGRNSKLKTWCKLELSKMIMKEAVRINWEMYNDLFKDIQ